jgi:alpha-glucosidase
MTNSDHEWWRGGVIYQIYPRSFADGNGDGVGDLPGILPRLSYVASLGIDAIWISPVFKSPMRDFGYDISDYCDVDPLFGTLEHFDELIAQAHLLGLKVIVDQVLSHCSDQHPWFIESRKSRDNPKSDWFVWADPQADGTPPNNWLSVFGGSAWQWEPRRGQYFLHNFLSSQPDLNFHHPDVRTAMLAVLEFWLRRGVDGFRLDACNFYFHDFLLRSNPPAVVPDATTVFASNPYGFQMHQYDKSRPENLDFLRQIRALLDSRGAVAVGEIGDDDSLARMAEYTAGRDRLHMAYCFNLLTADGSAANIRDQAQRLELQLARQGDAAGGPGWPCWSIGNHDVERVVSRWRHSTSGGDDDTARAKLYLAMSGSLKGSLCIYQGEELALAESMLEFDQIKDPYGIAFWPEFKGRDGCRTPMPWNSDLPHGGFSISSPWLPVDQQQCRKAVDLQEVDPESSLNFYRTFIAWRKRQPVLLRGSIRFLETAEPVLAFVRKFGNEQWLCAFNLGKDGIKVRFPAAVSGFVAVDDHPLVGGKVCGESIEFAGFGGAYARLL